MKKNFLILLFIFGLISLQAQSYFWDNYDAKTIGTIACFGLLSGYVGLKWLRTPNPAVPNLEELQITSVISTQNTEKSIKLENWRDKAWFNFQSFKTPITLTLSKNSIMPACQIQQGIPENQKCVVIYSPGKLRSFARTLHSTPTLSAYTFAKAGLINAPCVTFYYCDDRKSLNICGKKDQETLKLVYQEVVKKNPEAEIILYGDCRGAMNILRLLANLSEEEIQELGIKEKVKAIILESPPLSVQNIQLNFPIIGKGLDLFYRLVYPNYNVGEPTILDAKKFPDLPILLGRLPQDKFSPFEVTEKIIAHLRHIGCNQLRVFTSTDDTVIKKGHGFLGIDYEWRKAVNDLYESLNLPFVKVERKN